MQVERCVCSNITFKDVLSLAQKEGITSVDELQKRGICARNCKLCEPYLKKMFETGRTGFSPGEASHRDYSS